jgi:hypothetical protein
MRVIMSRIPLVVCLAVSGGVAGPLAVRGDDPLVPTKTSYNMLWRGDKGRLGKFDADGNFVPDARLPSYHHPPHFPPYYTPPGFSEPLTYLNVTSAGSNTPAYEHRSGRLIAGVKTPKGFAPEIGSKVLDLKKDYDAKNLDRIIYNMIDDETIKRLNDMRQKKFPDTPDRPSQGRSPPPGPDPQKAGTPEGYEYRPYRTYMKVDPWFARVIGDVMELGHLNDEGEFVPDYGLPVFPYIRVKQPDVLQDGSGRTIYYTLPKDGKDTEEVYEYRSGRLIRGTLHMSGNFVPELGSTVLDFKDYDPLGDRRIYNLPGVLRPAKK